MVWYIVTIALGIFLDLGKIRNSKNWTTYRNVYVVWLYVFLCFGYMNGSDWRDYEIQYEHIHSDIHYVTNEHAFYYLWYLISLVIKDYWVMAALLKAIYLTTVIKLTQKITPYWLATIGFLMPISLVFMLIQNPLRYMVALTVVNVAIIQFLNKKYYRFAILGVAAVFFHTSTLFFLLATPLFKLSKPISYTNRWILVAAYIIILYFSSNADLLNRILFSAIGMTMTMMEGVKDYTISYALEDNTSFYSIGSIINMMLFGVVLLLRDDVINKFENGRVIYGSVIIYSFLQRFCMMIPTGFRLVIPFGIFYAAYIVYALHFGKKLAWIFVLYFSLSYPRKLWNSYDLIPYTNSIYYIVTGHKPYMERSMYHYQKYQERTGHTKEDNSRETLYVK